jgi:lipopolysaccharide export system protein LptA
VTYEDHNINSDNLNLEFEKSLATISDNIIYKNLNTKLQADKVEIDLITKSSRIFMNNKLDKVNIIGMN